MPLTSFVKDDIYSYRMYAKLSNQRRRHIETGVRFARQTDKKHDDDVILHVLHNKNPRLFVPVSLLCLNQNMCV